MSASDVCLKHGVMTKENLQDWLQKLLGLLKDFRSEVHSDEWWRKLCDRLHSEGYKYQNACLAEPWILKGNRYGRQTTTYADFFPSKQEAESVDMNIVTMEFARRMVRQNADRVRFETRSDIEHEHRQLLNDARNALKETALLKYRIRELENELEESRKQGNSLEDNNTDLHERVRAMQQQQFDQSPTTEQE